MRRKTPPGCRTCGTGAAPRAISKCWTATRDSFLLNSLSRRLSSANSSHWYRFIARSEADGSSERRYVALILGFEALTRRLASATTALKPALLRSDLRLASV